MKESDLIRTRVRWSCLALALAILFAYAPSTAFAQCREICSDMDGDGIAETCIELCDEGGIVPEASFPGEEPPEVPEIPEAGPVE